MDNIYMVGSSIQDEYFVSHSTIKIKFTNVFDVWLYV